jgi:hypothetical protein
LLQYAKDKRDHRITIGRHGIDITAEQARLEALRLRGLIAAGETPSAVHQKPASSLTVADLEERYLEEYAVPHKKPSGIAQDRRNLANHIVPLIGKLPISAIECSDIARAMREIAAGKTTKDEKTKKQGRRIVRGGEIVANRVQALLSKMFALAEDWKLRPVGTNPAAASNAMRSTRSSDTFPMKKWSASARPCHRSNRRPKPPPQNRVTLRGRGTPTGLEWHRWQRFGCCC